MVFLRYSIYYDEALSHLMPPFDDSIPLHTCTIHVISFYEEIDNVMKKDYNFSRLHYPKWLNFALEVTTWISYHSSMFFFFLYP